MVNSYYGIYQAERSKTTAEIRAVDAQLGGLPGRRGDGTDAVAAMPSSAGRTLRG